MSAQIVPADHDDVFALEHKLDGQHYWAIAVCDGYLDYREDLYYQWGYPIEEYSYACAAVTEIISRLFDYPDEAPLDIIEKYERQMLDYYERKHEDLFIIAASVANEIIDQLINY